GCPNRIGALWQPAMAIKNPGAVDSEYTDPFRVAIEWFEVCFTCRDSDLERRRWVGLRRSRSRSRCLSAKVETKRPGSGRPATDAIGQEATLTTGGFLALRGDIEHCPNCGGELKIIAAILEAE
ncbi:MAG: hypothetical protein ABI809_09400, partial [Caldimonas sp.]